MPEAVACHHPIITAHFLRSVETSKRCTGGDPRVETSSELEPEGRAPCRDRKQRIVFSFFWCIFSAFSSYESGLTDVGAEFGDRIRTTGLRPLVERRRLSEITRHNTIFVHARSAAGVKRRAERELLTVPSFKNDEQSDGRIEIEVVFSRTEERFPRKEKQLVGAGVRSCLLKKIVLRLFALSVRSVDEVNARKSVGCFFSSTEFSTITLRRGTSKFGVLIRRVPMQQSQLATFFRRTNVRFRTLECVFFFCVRSLKRGKHSKAFLGEPDSISRCFENTKNSSFTLLVIH